MVLDNKFTTIQVVLYKCGFIYWAGFITAINLGRVTPLYVPQFYSPLCKNPYYLHQ